jgi:hypothetical protein
MSHIPSVSWQDLPGNKYVKSIDPAMLSDVGYVKAQVLKANQYSEVRYRNVIYDRDYLIGWVVKNLIKPLAHLSKERIDEVVEEAWALYCKQSIDPNANN